MSLCLSCVCTLPDVSGMGMLSAGGVSRDAFLIVCGLLPMRVERL